MSAFGSKAGISPYQLRLPLLIHFERLWISTIFGLDGKVDRDAQFNGRLEFVGTNQAFPRKLILIANQLFSR